MANKDGRHELDMGYRVYHRGMLSSNSLVELDTITFVVVVLRNI